MAENRNARLKCDTFIKKASVRHGSGEALAPYVMETLPGNGNTSEDAILVARRRASKAGMIA